MEFGEKRKERCLRYVKFKIYQRTLIFIAFKWIGNGQYWQSSQINK